MIPGRAKATLMGTGEGTGLLADLYEPETGSYFLPEVLGMGDEPQSLTRGVDARAIAIAVIDTGMLTQHPVIRPRLRHSVDFTGEGPEDLNGHGSWVTLLAVATAPVVALVNVKALDRFGAGSMASLARALDWCRENASRHNIQIVNLSAGVYHKRWGFFECRSDCEVCVAARKLHQKGVMLVAAAGNEGPHQMPCPQRVGVLENTFMVVRAVEPGSGEVTDYSGPGNIATRLPQVRRVPVS